MTAIFDPYYKWLAIPPDEQPPNHYRLLALPLFIDDSDVIESAADQRMAHVRSFQSGPRTAESQKLLSEIAIARTCLLDAKRKAEYDAALVAMIGASPIPAPPPVAPNRDSALSWVVVQKKRLALAAGICLSAILIFWMGSKFLTRQTISASGTKPTFDSPKSSGEPIVDVPMSDSDHAANRKDEKRSDLPVNLDVGSRLPYDADPDPASSQPDVRRDESPLVPENAERELKQLIDERNRLVKSRDIDAAWMIMGEIATKSNGDVLELRGQLLDALREVAQTPSDYALLTTRAIELVNQALGEHRHVLARQHAPTALFLARKSGDPELIRQATKLVLEVQKLGPRLEGPHG